MRREISGAICIRFPCDMRSEASATKFSGGNNESTHETYELRNLGAFVLRGIRCFSAACEGADRRGGSLQNKMRGLSRRGWERRNHRWQSEQRQGSRFRGCARKK